MEKEELQSLKALMRSEIERKVGYPLQSSAALRQLADMILAETHEYVSPTTLKRFWDLYEGHHAPRPSIWNALAMFVGDANYAAFCRRMNAGDGEISGEVGGRRIVSGELPAGARLEITWAPDRVVTVCHREGDLFEIVSSVNSKLVAGATFRAPYIIEGLPMVLEDYRATPGATPIIYEAGRSGGVAVSEL